MTGKYALEWVEKKEKKKQILKPSLIEKQIKT